jgi:hypothetical protein
VCVCKDNVTQHQTASISEYSVNYIAHLDHHATVHAEIADVVDGSQLWRIDWNLFNNTLQGLFFNFELGWGFVSL